MRFKLFLFVIIFSFSGCGLFGTKNKPSEENKVNGTGCLNDSKDLVNRYVSGNISQSEWKSAFSCINQSLDFFTQYVRGTNLTSYNQADIHTLITRFMITNRSVSSDLVIGAFKLKQSLLGGDDTQFTKEQIELLKTALTTLEKITSDLIPYLKQRQDPKITYSELIQIVNAFKKSAEEISKFVSTLPVGELSDKILTLLIDELTSTLDLPYIEGLDRKVFLFKWVLFNSKRDAIEANDWPHLFRTALLIGGMGLVLKTSLNLNNPDQKNLFSRISNDYHFREFIWNLAQKLKPVIMDSLTSHGGGTPFTVFDQLIDEIPSDILSKVPKQQIKNMIRPFIQRLLISKKQNALDTNAINTIYSLLENIVKDLGSLDRFYEKSGIDPNDTHPAQLRTLMSQYELSLSATDKSNFISIKNLILNYPALLYRDTGSVMHQNGVGYSRSQFSLVIILNRLLTHLNRTYGNGSGIFYEANFQAILEEPSYKTILNTLTWVDASIPNFYSKRFRDIDLFTAISDGNGQVSIPEIIHYAIMVMSAGKLTNKMREEITPRCDQNMGFDQMGWNMISNQCFRNEFYGNLNYWLNYFPRLKAYWTTLSAQQKQKAAVWLEHGSRRFGYAEYSSNDWVGKFDIGSAAAILHYTESLFIRFDSDQNETLTKNEVNNAYPIFKNLLYKKVKLTNNDYVLNGVFSYIVKYQSMPDTSSIGGVGTFALWLLSYQNQNYSTNRLGVFNIVCQLAAPENLSTEEAAKTNSRICR